jgi:hypothetical protein
MVGAKSAAFWLARAWRAWKPERASGAKRLSRADMVSKHPLLEPRPAVGEPGVLHRERAELDKTRSATLNRFATEREINGAYNRATFRSTKRTGARTSKIVDRPMIQRVAQSRHVGQ